MPKNFFVGCDLGKHMDYSAVVVLEKIRPEPDPPKWKIMNGRPVNTTPKKPATYHCRGIDRFPLGTLYTTQVEHITSLLQSEPMKGNYYLIIDRGNAGTYAYE